jgi:hypothetical protein
MQVGVRLPSVQWRLYGLNEDQLQALERGSNSPSLGLLGLFGGIAFSAVTTIFTVDLTDRAVAWFVGALVASAGLSLFLAIQSVREWRAMKQLIALVREQHVR